MKQLVVGMGYVGKALKAYLATFTYIESYDIKDNKKVDYSEYDTFFICVSTDYDDESGILDTSNVKQVVLDILKVNKKCDIYIKSTVNIGFCDELYQLTKYKRIFYIPEFLREKHAKEDIISPSRIVIGTVNKKAPGITHYLQYFSSEVETVITGYKEAESIKLLSNAYLAARIAYFNEIDTYAKKNNLNSEDIIKGISLDHRIGNYYNKPSFGYGGYCLPKDSETLSKLIGGEILSAAPKSNLERKLFIVNDIVSRIKDIEHPIIGIYGLDERYSPFNDIILLLAEHEIATMIYEENIKDNLYLTAMVNNDIKDFIDKCDLILTNQVDKYLAKCKKKLYLI